MTTTHADTVTIPAELARLAREASEAPQLDGKSCHLKVATLFDPITGPGTLAKERPLRRVAAQRYCAECPVRLECGTWADQRRIPGVAGGSLRYIDPILGYVSEALIKSATPSRFDIRVVRARRAAQRYGEE